MYKMTEKKVLVYGALNLDHVYSVDHFAGPGETISAKALRTTCGGKGLNQAVAFAKAGAQTYLAGKTGIGGEVLRDTCQKYGVNTDYLMRQEQPCGHAVIQVDGKGQNSIIIYGGTNIMQKREEIDAVLDHFQKGDFLILQNEINNLPYLIQKAYEKEMEIVLNPSPYHTELQECGLSKISWLILNEVEAFQMTGKKNTSEIVNYFKLLYPNMKIVLTLGEEGSVCLKDGKYFAVPCCKTEVVDTTAAGDTFTGFFFSEINRGAPVKNALMTASKAAALTVSRNGAAQAIPYLDELVR